MTIPSLSQSQLAVALLAAVYCSVMPGPLLAAESSPRSLSSLRVAENQRYLVTADGQQFFWLADTAWELLHRLNREETLHYLDVRAQQGFNGIQTVLIAELDGLNVPNRQGHRPLRDNNPLRPDTQPGPENDYWDDVDWVLDRATERGFYVALLPTWGEWVTPRFAKETIFSTPEQGYAYGHFLGARWKKRSNVVWFLGGDRQPTEKPHARAVWAAMAEGIADGVNGEAVFDGKADWSTTLMSYHSMSSSSKWWHEDPWLDFHSWGTYHSAKDWARSFEVAQADYALPNPKPTLNAEPCYEAHPMDYRRGNPEFTAARIRRAAWWSVMSGCLGHTYGADGVWMMSGPPRVHPNVPVPGLKAVGDAWPDPPLTWREALNLPGAQQLIHLRRFFEKRDFLNYVPDQTLLQTETNQAPAEDHLVAGRGQGWAAVYSPFGRAFSLERDAAREYRNAAWFNPRNGHAQPVADYVPSVTATFTPPNQGEDQDWVLVLEDTLRLATVPNDELAPLRVSGNHRHLVTTEGQPFLWLGDTAWALFYKLNREEVRTYLDDRQRKGFTIVQAVAYWYPHGEDGPGPHNALNAYGHRPFQGDEDAPDTARPLVADSGSPDDPNDYWDHADFIVRETRRRGLRLALLPCWGRAYVNAVMTKSRPTFTEETARSFGRFLGERYRGESHVIWVIGGDANPTSGVGDRRGVYRAMAEGVGLGVTGVELRHDQAAPAWDQVLITYHPDGDPAWNSAEFFHAEPWLDANGIETWKSVDKVYSTVARDYALDNPVKPTLFLEGAYEGGRYPEPGGAISALKVRRQAWQAMLAGAAGHTYGVSSIWHFQRKPRDSGPANAWQTALQFPGAQQVAAIMRRILDDHQWWTLQPDQSLMVEGAGKDELIKTAARSAGGERVLIYFPDSTPAQLDLPNHSWRGSWIRPETGEQVPADKNAQGQFEPPADWPDALLSLVVRTGE